MQIINQSCVLQDQTEFTLTDILKQIEKAARVSYLSWDKTTEDSYDSFVNRLLNNKECRPLEFGTIHFVVPTMEYNNFITTLNSHHLYSPLWVKENVILEERLVYITTNYRIFNEIFNKCPSLLEYLDDEIEANEDYYAKFPVRHTIHFTLARGILDEFRTHIGFSHMASSTRYINLSKDKFGKQVNIVKPCMFDMPLGIYTINENSDIFINGIPYITNDKRQLPFIKQMIYTENTYFILLERGLKPQEARDILPLSIESHLFMCGFNDMWNNFFKLRCASNAHPMAREIAMKANEMLHNVDKEIAMYS